MQPFLKIVGNGQRTARDLTSQEAEDAMTQILDGRASVAQTAAFMAALRIKEESQGELAAFTKILRQHSERLSLNDPHLVDICQPYDGRAKLPNLVPVAAFIAASAGARIAMHGRPGQNTSPKFGVGVGDVFAQLGIPIDLPLSAAADLLQDDQVGLAFVSSAQFSPRLEDFNTIRIDYGMRSFFNTIEKLINPFGASIAIAGVFHGPVMARVAEVIQRQGYQRGIVVQGPEGSIDVLPSRRSTFAEFTSPDGAISEVTIDPSDFGWWERSEVEIEKPITPQGNADLTLRILDAAITDPQTLHFRHGALMTAALMIYAAGKASRFDEAIKIAQAAFASGEPQQRLNRLKSVSRVQS